MNGVYPSLPMSPQDLEPLPPCDGPKLKPFNFQGAQQIEFLERLGDGLHAIVFKIKIAGRVYALKVVSEFHCRVASAAGEFIRPDTNEPLHAVSICHFK